LQISAARRVRTTTGVRRESTRVVQVNGGGLRKSGGAVQAASLKAGAGFFGRHGDVLESL
jgi:hypothetical protein